jgi:E3 ubiquitin-protein ligase MGRN1
VLMQKIWVQGTSFELQEIYGLEQNRSSNRANGVEDIEGKDCVICMNAERNTTVLPCRHMCMCYDCAQAIKVQATQAKCPICRNEVESMLKITLPPRT